ncbi:hypothetical protein M011DRAFT_412324 [Sporormia fimetaria CBS 119925]|uniref:Uncharacterized protein n=1 Tax=Sporormia fimetaria CBS 119925 TaxID=1340428 RepID=A0A6A6UXZ4_9PLEO|nr:hypothetical protein M011DRAFT_412324 [Sporormia fimetaria CBS 119925]
MPRSSPAPVQQEFLFVNASKSAKSSRQGRRNARSFVMQKARRERPWSTSKNALKRRKKCSKSTSPGSVHTDVSHTSSMTHTPSPRISEKRHDYSAQLTPSRCESLQTQNCVDCRIFPCTPGYFLCHGCLLLQPPVVVKGVNNRLFDPFGTGPVHMDVRSSDLISYYVAEMAPSTIAVDLRHKCQLQRSEWFAMALQNVGFMHSLLCTAALHMYIVGRCPMDTVIYHKAQAIAAVNAAISHSDPSIGISDATIGTVFCLLCVEEALLLPFLMEGGGKEQLDQREIHLNGLRRMLQLRGGLLELRSNRILQAFILWHSAAHAVGSFETPYIYIDAPIDKASLPHHPSGYRPKTSAHLLTLCAQAQVTESLIDLTNRTLVLIADLNSWFSDAHSTLDPLDLQNYSCILECLLLDWIRVDGTTTSALEDALCLALLILTVRVTEALQRRCDPHPLHNVAGKRLQIALNATSLHEWNHCADLLLWILSMGAISAEGSSDLDWYVHQLSVACLRFEVCAANSLLRRLHLCGWVCFKLDDAVYGLWDRVLDLRLEDQQSA